MGGEVRDLGGEHGGEKGWSGGEVRGVGGEHGGGEEGGWLGVGGQKERVSPNGTV